MAYPGYTLDGQINPGAKPDPGTNVAAQLKYHIRKTGDKVEMTISNEWSVPGNYSVTTNQAGVPRRDQAALNEGFRRAEEMLTNPVLVLPPTTPVVVVLPDVDQLVSTINQYM